MPGIAGQIVAVGKQGKGDNFVGFVCCGQVVCAEWRCVWNKKADALRPLLFRKMDYCFVKVRSSFTSPSIVTSESEVE